MISKNYLAAFLAVPMALAGCSSSDGPGPTSANVAHTADDSFTSLIRSGDSSDDSAEGKTASFSGSPRFLSRKFKAGSASNDETTTSVTVAFDQTKNTLTLKLGDQEIVFDTKNDRVENDDLSNRGYKKTIGEGEGEEAVTYHVVLASDELASIMGEDGADEPQSKFHATLLITKSKAGEYFDRGYMTVGYTPDREALEAKTTATYKGSFLSVLYDVTQPKRDQGRYELNGDMMLDADFASGTVSGEVTELTRTLGGSDQAATKVADTLAMKEASINGAFFESSFENTCPENCELEDIGSAVSGGFYGDKAQEAGGTFELEFTSKGVDYEGGGYFRANETTEAEGS